MRSISKPIDINQQNSASVLRHTAYPIDQRFVARWSPRSFDQSAVPSQDLLTMMEAARWAPSAYNVQPWRFLYSQRGDAHWNQYLSFLDPFNFTWAQNAGAIIILASSTITPETDPAKPFPSYSFDAGSAWTHIALQAQKLGYHCHAMGGIHHDKIQQELDIPKTFSVEIAIAIGKIGDASLLPEDLKDKETPSTRQPLDSMAFNGAFGKSGNMKEL